MGDVSAEPTMEEILSSIKRVIEESEGPPGTTRGRRIMRHPPAAEHDEPADEVLELSERAPPPEPPRAAIPDAAPAAPVAGASPSQRAEPLLSPGTAEATRGPLEALSRMIVKPDVAGADTLEGLVREMLRPMLRDWLDTNLPQIVETIVSKEIARISGRGL